MRQKHDIEEMLGLRLHFGGKPGSPPATPKPPAPTDAAANVSGAQAPRKGYGSTVLTSGQGVDSQTSKRTVLGG